MGRADGIVVTPSHNPPDDGGFKYNPPHGGAPRNRRHRLDRAGRLIEGSADAIYQNLNLLRDERPDVGCVFGADHIYRMDPAQMVEQHLESGAGVTVAALRASG
jgi:ADP-glucose pyrophosphorylase